ncbi:sorbitol dehydrogenase [Elysia marginata]|uniref:Sorbitol dehydrogenase n=1 Tax=Elysia marginata TaxID=1093978 RepID=A0AAV4I2B2_9GAST|nr:sorbitol dehydrogenase [Elysia marginata]
MTVILAAKAFGANKICSADLLQKRLDFASEIGADATVLVQPDEDPESAAKRIIKAMGREPDITIECSGSPSATSTGIFATRSRGMLLQIGFSLDSVSIPLVVATVKELDIRGNHSSLNSYPAAIEAISSGKVNVKQLVSHRFPLEESEQAFTVAANKEGYKVVIDCSRPGEV